MLGCSLSIPVDAKVEKYEKEGGIVFKCSQMMLWHRRGYTTKGVITDELRIFLGAIIFEIREQPQTI